MLPPDHAPLLLLPLLLLLLLLLAVVVLPPSLSRGCMLRAKSEKEKWH
jgi:hypothetical protein